MIPLRVVLHFETTIKGETMENTNVLKWGSKTVTSVVGHTKKMIRNRPL